MPKNRKNKKINRRINLSLFHNIKIFLKFRLMISRINYALKYSKYVLLSKHKKGHGIHSPFIFKLIKDVFNKKEVGATLKKTISANKFYKKSDELIVFNDLGAGSKFKVKNNLRLGNIIKQSGVPQRYGKLLFDLVQFVNTTTILELGTSVGISTSYIGSAAPNSKFTTVDASKSKLDKAQEITKRLDLSNIQFINEDFDTVLDKILLEINKLDFVFFDGNHKKEPTLKYFYACIDKAHNDSVFIFDDIHWSQEMETAWNEIKRNPKVRVSIDIFRMGIIFFRSELSYQHYVIKF